VAKPSRQADSDRPSGKAARDYARSQAISRKLAKVAPDDDPAIVAGAVVLFAAQIIRDSSANLLQARSYLDGMRVAIDNLLVNTFAAKEGTQARPPRARKRTAAKRSRRD